MSSSPSLARRTRPGPSKIAPRIWIPQGDPLLGIGPARGSEGPDRPIPDAQAVLQSEEGRRVGQVARDLGRARLDVPGLDGEEDPVKSSPARYGIGRRDPERPAVQALDHEPPERMASTCAVRPTR